MEEPEREKSSPWEIARVISGRLVGISRSAKEITIETEGEDGECFEEDYDLPEDFEEDQFEDLLDYLDLDVRVVLLDNTVMKIVCGGRLS